MSQQNFKATVQANERGRVFIALPFNPSDAWGVKPRHHVRGMVNEMPFRGSLGSEGGTFFMVLGAAWRRDCGIAAGNKVSVVWRRKGHSKNLWQKTSLVRWRRNQPRRNFLMGWRRFIARTMFGGLRVRNGLRHGLRELTR